VISISFSRFSAFSGVRVSILWAVLIFGLVAPVGAQEAVVPDLDGMKPVIPEIESLLTESLGQVPSDRKKSKEKKEEPDWARLEDSTALDLLKRLAPQRTVEGREMYDLENPPRRIRLYLYPYYLVTGLPRDLVDGFFGSMNFIPPFNMLFTGAMYEIVPTQLLMRHSTDRHGLWGRSNAQGHGWVDAENGWGFFSCLHALEFRPVNQQKISEQTSANEDLALKVRGKNEMIVEHNKRVDTLRTEYFEVTTKFYQAGNYREVVRRLLPYVQIDLRSGLSKAMLAGAYTGLLCQDVAERAWVSEQLVTLLSTCSKSTLVQVKREMAYMKKSFPARTEPALYLTQIDVQMNSYAQALSEAEYLLSLDSKNPVFLRLRVEAALASEKPEWIEPAIAALAAQVGPDSELVRHAQGRLAFVKQDYDQAAAVYRQLTQEAPDTARYHYLMGMTWIERASLTGSYNRPEAVKSLKRAIRKARTEEEESFYRNVCGAAEALDIPL
jgi:tetratricopeptide (TPR) repeat protein